jgi:hypothetical protein
LRAYTVAATAVTLGVKEKWVDNVLSHHNVNGVLKKKQGVVRRVTPTGLLILEIVLELSRTLGVPISRALQIATELVEKGSGEVALTQTSRVHLRADIPAISAAVSARLERAVEITPIPRRGRPRYK